uniref:DUF1700 domain-containing protein n=1 Tax=Loigolactobacillus rennini TaxID=238013 RepID=A0A1K2I9C1_9LACO|nr:hypothetical protein LREN565_2115 [Loigolactobacillus rennini]
MKRNEYLNTLRQLLSIFGIQTNQIESIIVDYEEYFNEGAEHGETDNKIIEHLGTPRSLAKQIIKTQNAVAKPKIEINFNFFWKHPTLIFPFIFYLFAEFILFILLFFEIFFIFSPFILIIGLLLGFPAQGGILLQSIIAILLMGTAFISFHFTQKIKKIISNTWQKYIFKRLFKFRR